MNTSKRLYQLDLRFMKLIIKNVSLSTGMSHLLKKELVINTTPSISSLRFKSWYESNQLN
jgi:hypothetical protein